ncbi:flagellar type III secretion system protein FlhB [Myxococcota bacterium]|nr:flagellar type III secretion system protein FlhB [Myxococcota bacterium]
MGDTGEKTEEATPEKLRKAKEEGQVPKSQDFVSALGFTSGFLTFAGLLTYVMSELKDFTVAALDAATRAPNTATIAKLLEDSVPLLFKLTLPIGGAVFVMGIFTNVIQTGFFLAFKVVTPKFDKINPINGLKGMFKLKKFIELLKNMLKMGIAAWLAWSVMSDAIGDMVLTITLPLYQSIDYSAGLLWDYFTKTLVLFAVIGLADLLYARHSFNKEMMMSKYDVKQEYKQSEGDPHMKGQRKQLAHELLFSGSMENVKNADAVVVNPEHIAVAIKYDKEKGKAPKVVAKGMRVHAEKIKEIAKHYGIPILRNVPLAQALNKLDIDEEIPEELYEAVAEVLSFVYKIKEEQENRQKKQREDQGGEGAEGADSGKPGAAGPRGPAPRGAPRLPGGRPAGRDNLLKRGR